MQRGIRACIRVRQNDDASIFRISAADDILQLLVDAHEREFSIPELVELTGASRSTVWRAVDLLDHLEVLRVRETAQRKYVSIDPDQLEKPDPVLAVEQSAFHDPIRAFVDGLEDTFDTTDEVERLVGVVVFGSVARGEADRKSDIDLFVVVEGDRTVARRRVTDVVADLRERRFDGDRYDFESYVETVESTTRAREKLEEIFDEGITLYATPQFHDLRREVLCRE